MEYDLYEIRQACLKRLKEMDREEQCLVGHNDDADQYENIIRQLAGYKLKADDDFFERFLELYLFRGHDRYVVRALKFAISLIKDDIAKIKLRWISKAVCGRLSKGLNACYDSEGNLVISTYELIPSLKSFLEELLAALECSFQKSEDLTKEKPHEYWPTDWVLAERALRVIVGFREQDQSFLPAVERLIKLHHDGKLRLYRDGPLFEQVKILAALRESARLLRQAQRKSPNKIEVIEK